MRLRMQAARRTMWRASVGLETHSSQLALLGLPLGRRSQLSTCSSFWNLNARRKSRLPISLIPFSNPSLRSRDFLPAPAFSNPHAIHQDALRGKRGKLSWADGWDPTKHEQALTTREGSISTGLWIYFWETFSSPF